MKKYIYFPASLIAIAISSGCSSVAPQNAALTAAHSSYNSARANPQVTNQAALELKEASDSLNKADDAFSKGQGTDTVNHLSYIANQKVGIAQETAKRKTSESAVSNAGTKRDQIRLEARTAEADAAKKQLVIANEKANWQAEDLAAADAELMDADSKAQRDQIRIKAITAEADAAKQQAELASKIADQQAGALADADAKAERDRVLIAQQEMQLKELNAKKTERGLVVTLGDVLFNVNKTQLKSSGARKMQTLADFLKQYPQQKVLIEGFTDSTGSESYNQELSDRRANAVRMALIDMGTGSNRITTHGYGEAFPVASNDTAVSRQLNRRVEITFSNDGNIAPR
ncbi:MAG: OmpA family protein [Gallionella sp.]|nr:OmpA family protein [Gallionella sp.]